jgi:hypothetical protein
MFAIGVLLLSAVVIPAHVATITVTNTNDSGPGSLRQAVADATNGETINFDPSLNGQFIMLTSGEIVIDKTVTITGPGADLLLVGSTTPFGRILHIMGRHSVVIEDLTIGPNHSGIGFAAGIWNDNAVLTLNNCSIRENGASNQAGGIFNDGSARLTLLNSAITDNGAGGNFPPHGTGGGIVNSGGFVEIIDSTISGNIADLQCGGICSFGTLRITNSTISGNRAGGGMTNASGIGGGIHCGGTTRISNSTISDNTAFGTKGPGLGGGIYNVGSLRINNSTISDNSATQGRGIYNDASSVNIGNTVLNSLAGENIFSDGGTITSAGYNLSSDDGGGYLNGPGDQINTDPLLGPLQDNGGPTFTHELLSDSPAIDSGDPAFTPPPWYDQRGPDFWRIRNDRIDIGSFEVQNGPAVTPTPTPIPTPTATPRPTASPRSRPTPRLRPSPP